jgi:precorrin-2 dehydrogenase/sirohydrochlorin ferrochelatase
MTVYPIFLNDLGGRRCVVLAGGHDTARKVHELLACGADVTVVGPDLPAAIQALAEAGQLTWIARPYEPGDLKGAFLAIATETNPAQTAPIWEEAQAEKVLFNAVDDVPHCSFVAGSVVRRGPLVFSISTSGGAPALAVRIREQLETTFGPAYGDLAALLGSLRTRMAERFPDFEERRRHWYALVDSDLLDLVAAGEGEAAR